MTDNPVTYMYTAINIYISHSMCSELQNVLCPPAFDTVLQRCHGTVNGDDRSGVNVC